MRVEVRPPYDYYLGDDVPEWEVYDATSVGVLTLVCAKPYIPSHLIAVQQADVSGNPWSIPAGKVEDTDLDPDISALRELREETGIQDPLLIKFFKYRKYKTGKCVLWYRAFVTPDMIPINQEYLTTDQTIYYDPPEGVDKTEISKIAAIPLTHIFADHPLMSNMYRPRYTAYVLDTITHYGRDIHDPEFRRKRDAFIMCLQRLKRDI